MAPIVDASTDGAGGTAGTGAAGATGTGGAGGMDAGAGFNYGLEKVRFLTPVAAGARVRLRVVLESVEEKAKGQLLVKTRNTLEIENSDKPALIAEALALVVPAKPRAREEGV